MYRHLVEQKWRNYGALDLLVSISVNQRPNRVVSHCSVDGTNPPNARCTGSTSFTASKHRSPCRVPGTASDQHVSKDTHEAEVPTCRAGRVLIARAGSSQLHHEGLFYSVYRLLDETSSPAVHERVPHRNAVLHASDDRCRRARPRE